MLSPVTESKFRSWLPGAAVIVVITVAALAMGSRLWFFSDDWNIMAGWPSGRLLEPFNSHLSLVPIAIYQLLFRAFGLESYVPFRVVGLAAYSLLGWATLRYSRPRVGTWGAALATAAVLWNAAGVTNVMFPFLLNFSLPIAALAAIWWHLDRADESERPVRDEVIASLWLAVALATSGLGLLTAAAIGVELLWNRPPLRRWLVLAPGPALWVGWYLKYHVDSPPSGGLRPIISYAVRMIWGGFTSLAGQNEVLGVLLAAAFAMLVLCAGLRWRTFDGRAAGALAAPAVFVVLTAVSRIGVIPSIPPDELRYQWTVGAFMVLTAVHLCRGRSIDLATDRAALRQPLIGAGTAIVAVALVANAAILWGDMGDWADTVEAAAPGVAANLWAAEQADAAGVLDRDRALPVSYVKVTAGDYVDAVRELGSPLEGFSTDMAASAAETRKAADQALIDDFAISVRPLDPGRADDPGCTAVDPQQTPPDHPWRNAILRITAGKEAVTASVSVFGPEGYATDVGTVAAGASGLIVLPAVRERSDAFGADAGYRLTLSGPAELADCST